MEYVMDYWSPEEFLAKLSIHHRIIYRRRRKTRNLHRSWILFYERVMVNDVVRLAVQNDGHKFWEEDPFFRFRFPYNRYGVGWRNSNNRVCSSSLAEIVSNVGENNFALALL